MITRQIEVRRVVDDKNALIPRLLCSTRPGTAAAAQQASVGAPIFGGRCSDNEFSNNSDGLSKCFLVQNLHAFNHARDLVKPRKAIR